MRYRLLNRAFFVVCLLSSWVAGLSSAGAADMPNLLVLHTDEHHFKTLGCYGGRIVKTPHIDWLAKHGALCTSFYATSPVCSPSRAALVSGRYPQNTDVTTNNIPLNDNVVTFAEALRRKGYATGYAGKWHLDGTGKPQWAPARKFGFEDNRFMFNRGHWKKFIDRPEGPAVGARKNGKPTYAVDGADEKTFATDWLTDKAIAFIKKNRGKPFCYMVSYPDPHGPNTVRQPYDTMYSGAAVPIPPTLAKAAAAFPKWAPKAKGVTAAHIKKIMPAYYGMVKCIDDNVGRLLATLREAGELDNTVIVFTSDHGDLCGEHCRLNKGVPYEGSARIPFILYQAGKVDGGLVVNEALSCVDFMPTVLSLMGHADALKGLPIEGRDASRLFAGRGGGEWNDVAFLRGTSNVGWLCAVTDRYKLVYSVEDEPWLIDLKKDPNEVSNVFNEPANREVIRRLTRELDGYVKAYRDPRGDEPAIRKAMDRAMGAAR